MPRPSRRRSGTLDKHIEQGQYYLEFKAVYEKYKQQKPKKQEDFREETRESQPIKTSVER
jgi:hypothetical protein